MQVAKTPSEISALLINKEPSSIVAQDPQAPGYKGLVKPTDMTVVSMKGSDDDFMTGCDASYDGEKLDVNSTASYDEKDRLLKVESPDGDYDRYVYAEDEKGRTVQRDWYAYRKSYVSEGKADGEILAGSQVYSYDHIEGGDSGDKAYLVKNMQYVANPEYPMGIKTTKEYIWFEPAQSFIFINSTEEKKTEVAIDGHSFTCSLMRVNDHVKLEEQVVNSDENSTITKTYDEQTGELKSCTGSKSTVEKADGYITTINYTYRADNGGVWDISSKDVVTDNWEKPLVYDGQHREEAYYLYNSDKKEFEFDTKKTYDWLHQNPNILLTSNYYSDGDEIGIESSTEIVDDKGNWVSYFEGQEFSAYAFKDGRCVVVLDDSKKKHATWEFYGYDNYSNTFVMYGKDGEEQARYRLRYISHAARRTMPLEIYKDGKWQNLEISTDNFTLQLGDNSFYQTMVFNKEGYPVKDELYDGNKLYSVANYTYTDNSCLIETYEHGELYSKAEFSVGENGSHTTIFKEYDEGEPYRASKEVVNAEGVCYSYGWDWDAKDFKQEPSEISVLPASSVADGVNVTISRSWQDGKIVETQKTEQKEEEDGSDWSITYNKVDDAWKPESKSVTEKLVTKPQFDVTLPACDIKRIKSDDAITEVDNSALQENPMQNHYDYKWDEAGNDWNLSMERESTYRVDGNTLTYSMSILSENGSSQAKTVSYTRDANKRLVEYTLDTENSGSATRSGESSNTSITKSLSMTISLVCHL